MCGTFLEIHRPLDEKVLASVQLFSNVINIPLVALCAGTYHIWLVEHTRSGKVIMSVDAFYIYYPSCAKR